jgi:hypothetical protein
VAAEPGAVGRPLAAAVNGQTCPNEGLEASGNLRREGTVNARAQSQCRSSSPLTADPAGNQHAADVATQRELVNEGTVGVISGGVTGTYIRIAADLADALDDGYQLRILPIIGKGSVRNIEDLLLLRGIDVAIVQSDVLDFYKRAELVPNIENKIHYISRLYGEEVYVLAKSEHRTIDDLAGKRVNFGTEGSGTFMTAGIVFEDLGLDVEITSHPEPTPSSDCGPARSMLWCSWAANR